MIATAEKNWQSYKQTLPPDASEVQIAETHRAFMAGMVAWDSQINYIVNLDDPLAEHALGFIREDLRKVAAQYVSEGKCCR